LEQGTVDLDMEVATTDPVKKRIHELQEKQLPPYQLSRLTAMA
jgi:hypothetical protein